MVASENPAGESEKVALAAASSVLPVKWRAEASDAQSLPVLDEAIAAFRMEFELNRLGMVQTFHSSAGSIAVYGCKIAVEFSNQRTLHFRMRTPGSPWLLNAELISTWPEMQSHVRLRSVDQSWLELALSNMFEAWCEKWLPAGYRYADAFEAVIGALAGFLEAAHIARQWENALRDVLPSEFHAVFGLTPLPWANLHAPAAPFRIWNHHSKELESLPSAESWLREIVPVLRYFPADLAPGPNLVQSLRLMVVQRHSITAWRFHLGTKFALVPGGELLVHPLSDVGAAIVMSAVVGLGMRNAVIFLMAMGAEGFRRMCVELNECGSLANWSARLPLFIARAAGRLNEIQTSAEQEDVTGQIILALRGLARTDFTEGLPAVNSTWNSLWQRADASSTSADSDTAMRNSSASWTVHLAAWAYRDVKFTAIASPLELKAEEVQMVHGIESRLFECATGDSVIYRIEGALPDGEVVRATVEYARKARHRRDSEAGEKWILYEIKGRFNAEVDPLLLRVALMALDALNGAG